MFGNGLSVFALMMGGLAELGGAFQIHGKMLTLTRLDPIVNPGAISGHAHIVTGGSNFGPTLSTKVLENSNCSTLQTQQDMSAYWVAPPYGRNPNGTWSALPVTFVAVYYLRVFNDTPMTPFPENFRMLMGSPSSTTQNPNKDWTSFQCNNFIPPGDVTGNWDFTPGWTHLPTMDCTVIKMAMSFPNCWDGVNVDSANHRDHVSYAVGEGWRCPPSHPKQIPQIVLEFEFFAEDYKWQDVSLSSGSTSGDGVHGDYFFGWKDKGAALMNAMEDPTCMGSQGILPFLPAEVRCEAMLPFYDEAAMEACSAGATSQIVQEEVGIQRAIPELPGCNPLFDRPGLPSTKPACPTTPPVPKIGLPSRLIPWWDHDPGHNPQNMPVYDGFNSAAPTNTLISSTKVSSTKSSSTTASSTKASSTKTSSTTTSSTTTKSTKMSSTTSTVAPTPTPTGPNSGTMYLTTGQNWDGTAENLQWNKGNCNKLTSKFASNVGSAGPDSGKCAFFDDTKCAGTRVLEMTFPGKSNLGSVGKRFKSFLCV